MRGRVFPGALSPAYHSLLSPPVAGRVVLSRCVLMATGSRVAPRSHVRARVPVACTLPAPRSPVWLPVYGGARTPPPRGGWFGNSPACRLVLSYAVAYCQGYRRNRLQTGNGEATPQEFGLD